MNNFDAGEISALAEGLDLTLLRQNAYLREGHLDHIAKCIEKNRDGQRFVITWGAWAYNTDDDRNVKAVRSVHRYPQMNVRIVLTSA